MSQNTNFEDNEIDLSELFAALWAHKILITLFTGVSIFLAGYHALTAEKKFTATSIFQIEQNDNSPSLNIPGELGALASLAGLNGAQANSGTDILIERAMGREFIIDMQQKFSIDRDLYFNTLNPDTDLPDYKDPFWKAAIKKIIGWQKTALEKNAIIESNVVGNYRENVLFGVTDGGAIEISVTHINPQKASYYANSFMEEIRQMVEEESNASKALRLNYLSETLGTCFKIWKKLKKILKTML